MLCICEDICILSRFQAFDTITARLCDFPPFVDALLAHERLNEWLSYFLLIRPKNKEYMAFNDRAVSTFYRTVLRLCQAREPFLETVRGHANFLWAVNNAVLFDSCYVASADEILKVAALCARKPAFRATYIGHAVSAMPHHMIRNPANIVRFLDLLLQTKDDLKCFLEAGGMIYLVTNTLAGLQRWHSIWTDRTKLPVINAEMSRFRFLQLLKTFVAHVHTIEGHQFTPGSLKSGISALLRVFNDAHKTNLKLSDPDALETKRIVLGKLRDLINNGHRDGHGAPLVEPPLEAAVAATLNPDSNEDLVAWTLWLLLSKAGLRLKEAQDITLDDLDFQADGALLVRPPGVTKNHQPSVEVDRSPDLIRHLAAPQDVTWFRRLIAARPKKPTTPTKLFLALNRANPQTPFKAQPMGEKLLRKIFHGVFSRVEGGQLITPHSGRRTLQTRAARAGATVAQRLALTGHKSIASLARYETPTTGDMHAVAVKLAAASPAPTPPPPIVPVEVGALELTLCFLNKVPGLDWVTIRAVVAMLLDPEIPPTIRARAHQTSPNCGPFRAQPPTPPGTQDTNGSPLGLKRFPAVEMIT
ncbi:hypothetical protein PAPYR_10471 [Paratrimastix pyriformis]|uniref:Tyr recombinase domain-containing protein n=1 Tax=Paratrimastix pyriformis TaxID=342808 RepID=A0ABQ8UBP2_9EUKA|nr:hypothetical protein PAPYR_10471 [Paratrimastix pyriformis]